jgi:hypothetical protein
MRTVRVDFVEPPVPSTLMWLSLLFLALVLGAAGSSVRKDIADAQALAATKQQQRLQEAREAVKRRDTRPVTDARATELERMRGVAWPEVLTALESVPKGGVSINAFAIDVGSRLARVEVVAEESKAIVEFVASLNAGASPSDDVWHWSIARLSAVQPKGFSAEVLARRGK